ncbi:sensor domain-containing diguanylate cyclase [Aureimonas sp. SA4125]|uniref:sensor domain-containing diguanylate cyclase n=1 Tax=Aureimonas sp. SA4125 TaxID=2826993 RepID=UPI001CC4BCBC|nr:sensor domain-containing diguanylate cyclase [Aureimonas sp. SA4125]
MSVQQAFNRLRDRTSMKHQSAVVTALLLIATVALIAIPTAVLVYDNAIKRANMQMRDLATTMAQRLDREMFERFREIQNIASFGSLGSQWRANPSFARTLLDQLQKTLPSYAWIGFATADGTVQASTQGMLRGASVVERPWFKAGLKGPAALDIHEAKLLAKVLEPLPDGQPFRFVDVTAPVRDEAGVVAGVLGAHLSWSWANDVRTQLLSTLDPALETGLLVTAADGSVILGGEFGSVGLTDDQIEMTKAEPRNFVVEQNGHQQILAAVPTHGAESYPGLGWRVVAHRPKDVALAGAYRITATILGIGLLAALGSVACAFFAAARVTRPISQLAVCADRIGRSPGAALFDRQRGSSDVLHLSDALRSLSRRLDFAEHDASEARDDVERSLQARSVDAERHQQIVQTLRLLADTDPMTSLLNRRSFLAQATDVLAFFRRYRSRFAILVVDIDHFKRVNDTHGHAAGDEVIRAVARSLSDAARQTDRIARFGGEEFVVLLREIDQQALEVWAERARQSIEAMTVSVEGVSIKVTISIGATISRIEDRDVEDIIRRADGALYSAKSTGRNRTSIAGIELVAADALAAVA